ncbi:hypothetical protein INR49_014635 [Caranx melampygus]|nr:hypothetical protein INR49_014635 [Caranx melampygus]
MSPHLTSLSSALTPEECQPLVTPLSMADTSMMHGRNGKCFGSSVNITIDDNTATTDSELHHLTL